MSERIPESELKAAADLFCAKAALHVIRMMNLRGLSVYDLAKLADCKPDTIRRKLAKPHTISLSDMGCWSFLMGFDLGFEVHKLDEFAERRWERPTAPPPWTRRYLNANDNGPMASTIAIDRAVWGLRLAA